VSNNFCELVSKDVEPIMTIRKASPIRGWYINITLKRKLGFPFIHYTKYFER